MANTIGTLVDRAFRDWLYPPDDQPTRTTLNGAITSSAATLTYNTALLAAEEEFLLGPGTLIEINQEQILVGAVDTGTNILSSLVRGVNGTEPTAHASNDVITIRPTFTRRAVFDALSSSVVGLYPRLYRRRAVEVTLTSNYTEVPEDVEIPEAFVCFDGGRPVFPRVRLIDLPSTSTGKALLTIDASAGTSGSLIYRARFPRPISESSELEADLGVLPEYETALVVRAVSHVIASRDMDPFTTEFLTRQLEAQFQGQQQQPGSRIREGLLRYYEYLMTELTRNTEAVHVVNGWVRGF